MAKMICPSCGKPYNGTKCRSCLYEHFSEEIAHRNHVHKGEPLVIGAPVRKPIQRKDPFGCEKRTRKRHPLVGFLVLLFVINALLPMILNWGLELETMKEYYIPAEPEIVMPSEGLIWYDDGTILVMADWQDGQKWEDGFSVYVRNETDADIAVSARDILVNGYLMGSSHLYCAVEDGCTEASRLYVSETDLHNAGIQDVQDISFCLEIYRTDSYETIAHSDPIALTASVPGDAVLYTEPDGVPVFEQEGIRVQYLGYSPNEYYPDDVSEGTLLFYLENTTDRYLYFDASEMSVNGETSDLYLWCGLPAQTRCVTTVYLSTLEDMGIRSISDIEQLSFQLEVFDPDDYEFSILTEPTAMMGA